MLAKLLSIDKNLDEAYKLKEEYREFNLCRTYDEAKYMLYDFIERFKKSYFVEFREFAKLLERWDIYIINSFIIVDGKRMSNGPMESVNSRIKRIMYDGYGYTNFKRFRNKILFSLNKGEPIK